jgi:hypothetical protein
VIRRVAFSKAIVAGVAGALAWELLVRGFVLAGVPLFDLVYVLGTLMVGEASPWAWWPAGVALHAVVGTVWATFYAYFFWSTFEWSPALQGAVFAICPAILAGFVMLPHIGFMHPFVLSGRLPSIGMFALGSGWGGPVTDAVGHLAYGVVMGALYTRPVGYAVARRARAHG